MKVIPTLCCLFKEEPVKFKKFTLKSLEKLSKEEIKNKVLLIYCHNISTLQLALDTCKRLGIESYRIGSDLLPSWNYVIENNIIDEYEISQIKYLLRLTNTYNINLSMHLDQFCIMNSPKEEVVKNSVEILKYHFYLASILPISAINIHVGGVYGDKESAIERFIDNCHKYLTREQLDLLTIENDEKSYNITDIIYIANKLDIRPTFDIHHEKCYAIKNYCKELDLDNRIKEALNTCKNIWKMKGYNYMQVHLSSPKSDRYKTLKGSQPHNDYILKEDYFDFLFLDFDVIVDIEAKAKELAVKDYKILKDI